MTRSGAGLAALLCAAAVVVLPACSGDSGGQTMTGRVQSTIPAFCLGGGDAKGTCFITSGASGVQESDLHPGDCVTVTYEPASGGGSAHATEVARSEKC
jgi:hypothetical protein